MIQRDSIVNATATRAIAPLAVLTLAAVVLLRFPPAQNIFYPRCPIQEYLHLQCPGCGATRAVAALLNGHCAEALRFNALVVALLPLAGVYGLLGYRRFLQRKPLRWPQPPPAAVYAGFAATLLFTVLRNLPH
ncbi:MAG TPA: DUF2752 domain-containing protein [Bryobacteraceae bacterium]|jgi:hypothetical protein|nr:DUF2752 domain-containing protein [Bryobacteraceae bacterium]